MFAFFSRLNYIINGHFAGNSIAIKGHFLKRLKKTLSSPQGDRVFECPFLFLWLSSRFQEVFTPLKRILGIPSLALWRSVRPLTTLLPNCITDTQNRYGGMVCGIYELIRLRFLRISCLVLHEWWWNGETETKSFPRASMSICLLKEGFV